MPGGGITGVLLVARFGGMTIFRSALGSGCMTPPDWLSSRLKDDPDCARGSPGCSLPLSVAYVWLFSVRLKPAPAACSGLPCDCAGAWVIPAQRQTADTSGTAIIVRIFSPELVLCLQKGRLSPAKVSRQIEGVWSRRAMTVWEMSFLDVVVTPG